VGWQARLGKNQILTRVVRQQRDCYGLPKPFENHFQVVAKGTSRGFGLSTPTAMSYDVSNRIWMSRVGFAYADIAG